MRLWGSWLLCVFYGLFYLLFATCLQHVLLGDKVQLKNTASTYFSILKAELKQAFIDEYLTVDISAKVKGITNIETPRVALTMNEVQMLVDTPSFLHLDSIKKCRVSLLEQPISYLYKLYSIYILAINHVKTCLHLLNTYYSSPISIGGEWERNGRGMGAARIMMAR